VIHRYATRCFAIAACAFSAHACTLTGDDFDPVAVSEPPAADCSASECPGAEGSSPAPPDDDALPEPGVGSDPPEGSESELPSLSGLQPAAPPPAPATGDTGADPAPAQPDPALPSDALVGWASVAGLGVETTTGGAAGATVLATTAAELADFAARTEPLRIEIAGSVELSLLDVSSNKTLLGRGSDAVLHGGIRLRGSAESAVSNVIIANLHVDAVSSGADGDAIQLHAAHHVWIDHCSLSDAADGLLDIVHASDFVTISFNRFFYTSAAPAPDHRFANLIGHSVDNATEDADHLNVTLHHNWWGEGVSQVALARFGDIHFFNNLFASAGNQSTLTAGKESRILVENNSFEGVTAPHAILPGSAASLFANDNLYLDTTGARDASGTAFVPTYDYALESAEYLASQLSAHAGPQ
jgi:pectate lyase